MFGATRRDFLIMVSALALAKPAMAEGAGISTGKTGIAIQGYDTRAYWSKGMAEPGSQTFVVTWRDTPWHFASRAEADQFAADHASFAPQFCGFCTIAMSFKKVVDGDPEVWRIFEGGLYLFARPVGGKAFDKGQVEMIAKAQAHWDSLN